MPRGAGALPGPEREAAARAAAASLGGMLGYRTSATAPRLAVLSKAIEILAELEPEAEMTLRRLTDFVASEDDSLVNAIGHLEPKHFKKLVDDLASFQFLKGHLLAPGGERVNAERLLGLGADDPVPGGKTRLSIISTRFFDDTAERAVLDGAVRVGDGPFRGQAAERRLAGRRAFRRGGPVSTRHRQTGHQGTDGKCPAALAFGGPGNHAGQPEPG